MAFEVEFDDIEDPESLGGRDRVLPGEYHMLVDALDEDGGRNGAMRVDFQVLRGTTPNMESKMYPIDFSKDYGEHHRVKLAAFAIAARLHTEDGQLVTAKLIAESKAKRQGLRIKWEEAVGRSVCMKLVLSKDEKYVNLDWDRIWSPDDKRASHIPLHAKALERDGIKLQPNRHIDGILSRNSAASNAKSSSKTSAKKDPAAASAEADSILDGVI